MDYSKIDFTLWPPEYFESPMDKSIHTYEYKLFLELLREAREKTGVTQGEVASKLGETQTFISKCERGERRIDVLELYLWCDALGISMSVFVQTFEAALRGSELTAN